MKSVEVRNFLPHTTTNRSIKIKTNQYSTSQDPRGCIPVYEYEINGQPIMWDRETGHVHFTGIWKALNNSKADIVKIVDSNPELQVKKVRGGCLVIQGTWIPFNHAFSLCARTAWSIRMELLPIFGPSFLDAVLPPDDRHFGCLVLNPLANGSQRVVATKPKKTSVAKQPAPARIPYKRDSVRSSRRSSRVKSSSTNKKAGSVTASMSVSRLLNEDEDRSLPTVPTSSSHSGSPIMIPSSFVPASPAASSCGFPGSCSLSACSPSSAQSFGHRESFCRAFASPSLRVVPTFNVEHSRSTNQVLPSLCPEITAIFESEAEEPCPVSAAVPCALSPLDVDIIERVEASIRLQCLSQDFGRRPHQPLNRSAFPTKVRAGNNVYKILWDH
ncbi:hypothetical protein G6F37_002014 [Rhizopus arrhizus]|nr:hypothetical protein G6F38_002547 [Rhizopus arrhizus]KAG1162599.1 hypothetical protein G6F37_002014 [Rhizopus arrhizus]